MSTCKIKILYIHHGAGIGGAPLSLLYLIQKIDKSIFAPKVLFLTDSEAVDLFRENDIDVRVLNLKHYLFFHWEPTWYRIHNIWRFMRDLIKQFYIIRNIAYRTLKEENPSIVHFNSTFLAPWAIVAKKCGISTVLHVRETLAKGYFGIRKRIYSKIINKFCDKVIAISYDNLNRLNLNNGKGSVIYNFVDFDKFDKYKSYPELFKRQKDDIIVTYLGGQIKYKGFHEVVDCLQLLNSNIKVVFAGYYKFYPKLKYKNPFKYHYLKKMYNSENAIVMGISNKIPALLKQTDIVLFPSNKPHFARPVIEAFAMSTPVIVSDVKGNNEIVKKGITGQIFKSGSPKDLADKINILSKNKEKMLRWGNKGYYFAKEKFDSDINSKHTFEKYYELLKI
ncbi:MAG TPA: glycosyltransferase family 4 protein [Bacteroidales bacterium]|nr:glycosyltransferase family 4 protein [Bacteroidales bacterium]